jgi:hypothetical protein
MIPHRDDSEAAGFLRNCLRRFEAACRTVERGLAMFGRNQNEEHLAQRSQGRSGMQRKRHPPISHFVFVVFVSLYVGFLKD